VFVEGNISSGVVGVSFVQRVLARYFTPEFNPVPGALMGVYRTFYVAQDDNDASPAHKRQKPKLVCAFEECYETTFYYLQLDLSHSLPRHLQRSRLL